MNNHTVDKSLLEMCFDMEFHIDSVCLYIVWKEEKEYIEYKEIFEEKTLLYCLGRFFIL